MAGFLGWLVVNLVVLLICFIAYSSQIFVIWPWYGREISVQLVTLLVPFNCLVGMLLWNYFLCVTTDPGHPPDNWRPDTNAEGYEVKKLTGGPRFCRYCERPKPPRTHHCRQCGRCVLRMDHHCPWINNCVGHFNHGHFIRFLFYVDLACSYHLAMVTLRVYSSLGARYWDEPETAELVFIILNYVACVPVLMAVGAFSLYHFNGLKNNTTTIEGWEKDKAATMVRRGKIREIRFPYNIGRRKNIESILGKNAWLWCWPTVTPGSGLKYELTADDGVTYLCIMKWFPLFLCLLSPLIFMNSTQFIDGNIVSEEWPPRDPAEVYHEDPNHEFVLPDTPWTYENGSVNPELLPSNSTSSPRRRKVTPDGTSSLPPYHPDYRPPEQDESSDDDYGYTDPSRVKVRRGSEGYEVRPAQREDMLARYLLEIGETPQRYHRYIPQPESEDSDEDVPLGQQHS